MKEKLLLFLVGSGAFLFMSVLAMIVQTVVGGFLPNNSDPPGQMVERPLDKARREAGKTATTQPAQNTTQTQAKQPESKPEPETVQTSESEPSFEQRTEPTLAPEPRVSIQPTPSRGPGNLDAPLPPSRGPGNIAPPPPVTGPGNLHY